MLNQIDANDVFRSQVQDTDPRVLEKENDNLKDSKVVSRLKFSHDKCGHQQSSGSHEEQDPRFLAIKVTTLHQSFKQAHTLAPRGLSQLIPYCL